MKASGDGDLDLRDNLRGCCLGVDGTELDWWDSEDMVVCAAGRARPRAESCESALREGKGAAPRADVMGERAPTGAREVC